MYLKPSAGLAQDKVNGTIFAERRHFDRPRAPTPLQVGELPRQVKNVRALPYASASQSEARGSPEQTPGSESQPEAASWTQAPHRVSVIFGAAPPYRPSKGLMMEGKARKTALIEDGLADEEEGDRQKKKWPVEKHLGRNSALAQAALSRAPPPWASHPGEVHPSEVPAGVQGSDVDVEKINGAAKPEWSASAQTAKKNASSGPFASGLNNTSEEQGQRQALGFQEKGRQSKVAQEAKSKQLAPWDRGGARSSAKRAVSEPPDRGDIGKGLQRKNTAECLQDSVGHRRGRQSPRGLQTTQRSAAPWEEPQALPDQDTSNVRASSAHEQRRRMTSLLNGDEASDSARPAPLMSSAEVDEWRASSAAAAGLLDVAGHRSTTPTPRQPRQLVEALTNGNQSARSTTNRSMVSSQAGADRLAGIAEKEAATSKPKALTSSAADGASRKPGRPECISPRKVRATSPITEREPGRAGSPRKQAATGTATVGGGPARASSPRPAPATATRAGLRARSPRTTAPPSARNSTPCERTRPSQATANPKKAAAPAAGKPSGSAEVKPKPAWTSPNELDRFTTDKGGSLPRVGTARQRGVRERDQCQERIKALKAEAQNLQDRKTVVDNRLASASEAPATTTTKALTDV